MKKILFYLVISILFFSCNKEEETFFDTNESSQKSSKKSELIELNSSKTTSTECVLSGSSVANLGGYLDYNWDIGSQGGWIMLSDESWSYQSLDNGMLRIYFAEDFTCGRISTGNNYGCSKEIIVCAPGITDCNPGPSDCEILDLQVSISGPTYMPTSTMTWTYNGDTSNIVVYRWWYKKVNGNGEPFVIAYGKNGVFSATADTFASVGVNSYFEIYLEVIDDCGFHYFSPTYTILKKGKFKIVSPM